MHLSYNGETFYQNHKKAVHTHGTTSLGNLDNTVLALGGYKVNNPELELYDIGTDTWTVKTPYPYCTFIYRYAVVSRGSSVYIIGGQCNGGVYASRIAKYTEDEWTEVGNLQTGKYAPRAISNGDRFYVVGGRGTYSSTQP